MFVQRCGVSVAITLLFAWMITTSSANASSSNDHPFHSSPEAAVREKKIKPSVTIQPAADSRQNSYPIILVHGLGGFDQLYSLKYWGGLNDIKQDLTKRGYDVYVADIGTVSSNWDRAVELYAQIKGGRVDYGKVHAETHGHARYGRTYSGLYPEWGEVDEETGKVKKVHLIGHSMGGQTIRVLTQLLQNGDKNESASTDSETLSPLFNGEKKPWVASVMTISTPHDGSTLTYHVQDVFPKIQQLIAAFAAVAGNREIMDYDFKLDQWGLKRLPGESFDAYMKRVCESKIWEKNKDTSEWDLSLPGAMELNRWVQAQPDVFYFSVSNEQTYRSILTGHELPEPLMNPAFYSFSIYMGRHTRKTDDFVVDRRWFKNDGMVNTRSMDGPSLGSTDLIVFYEGQPERGKWNHLGMMRSYDHLDVIGWGVRDLRPWYRELAALLASLPE
ncbi:esterase/lipase family protein [Desmospora profundinema]|uniref:triacylglycerol lipase n=1 Tax=Desmospora profundinema TaxID=1571184 RepID=A0ABU1IQ05_9BACL|nr:lipase [Desmospora profundinema]MDR6226858.1 triacylglycerol lipase [Desmospora profundinema]